MDKAQTGYTIVKSFTWFLFLIIVLFSIIFLVKNHITLKADIKDIEADIFYQEVMFTKNGITYQDDLTRRSYPGIIDFNKFNKEVVTKTIYYGPENYFLAANFTLNHTDGKFIKSFLYNEEWYNRWKPLTKRFLPGSGSATLVKKQNYVLVKQQENIFPAILSLEIIYPNK